MKYNIINAISLFFFFSILFSCKNDKEDNVINPLDGLVKLKEDYAIGASAKIEIWGKKNFFVGYNHLVVAVYDSLHINEKLTDVHLFFLPAMSVETGGTMTKQTTPVEDPGEEATNGVFPGAVSFVMPSGSGNNWQLIIGAHNHKYDKYGEATFSITVDNPALPVLSVFTSQSVDSSSLVLSLVGPATPAVGMNDIEFTIHRKVSDIEYLADNSCTIEIDPEMPSMGHGSPNNVNPVSIGNGHYKGKVNFTMTGEWRLNVVVKKNGNTISKNAYFTISF